jgi:hypothetical protein
MEIRSRMEGRPHCLGITSVMCNGGFGVGT